MNIVISVEEFDPSKGYLEYYLAREMARLGHKLSVLSFRTGHSSVQRLDEGFQLVTVPNMTSLRGYHFPSVSAIAFLARFLEGERPAIVHCQPLFSPLSLVLVALRRRFGYKIVGSLLTGEFNNDGAFTKMFAYFAQMVFRFYVKSRCRLVFAKSPKLSEITRGLFGVERTAFKIVPLGADPELFKFDSLARQSNREALGLNRDDVVVAYSGKINPAKGLVCLIEASAPIITKDRRIKLLIIGRGYPHYVDYLKKLASTLGVSQNIIFHPWVDRTQLSALFSVSDLAVWPGSSSISIIEAAAIGLPILITTTAVDSYAIDNENGFAFQRGNSVELRKYLELLIRDTSLRKTMGHNSRALVEKSLNWKDIAMEYEKAYLKVLG